MLNLVLYFSDSGTGNFHGGKFLRQMKYECHRFGFSLEILP